MKRTTTTTNRWWCGGDRIERERPREREPVLIVIGGTRLGPVVLASDRRVSR
ncbi:hypothetical protein HanPSC8_Chr03g0092401 [Helianthus annuus]|nr:hypothetical protein HanPSC8_Chr03g0092401 [Helianthus annuus]